MSASISVTKTTKSPPVSPSIQQPKTPTIAGVYDGTPGVGTQEAIVERAKQASLLRRTRVDYRKCTGHQVLQ